MQPGPREGLNAAQSICFSAQRLPSPAAVCQRACGVQRAVGELQRTAGFHVSIHMQAEGALSQKSAVVPELDLTYNV